MLNISIIGINGHAQRQYEILKNMPDMNIQYRYDHKRNLAIEDLMISDAIIISSPTPTHMDYLRRLKNYKGYIMVEKTMVTNLKDLKEALSWSPARKKRIKINFNFRYSELANLFTFITRTYQIGEPLYLSVHTSHFRKVFNNSWRSKLSNPEMEMVGTHYLNFIYSQKHLSKKFKLNLFHDYNSNPLYYWFLFCREGFMVYDGHAAAFYTSVKGSQKYPRPELTKVIPMDFDQIWQESLKKSMEDFLEHVESKTPYPPKEFEEDLRSIRKVFE